MSRPLVVLLQCLAAVAVVGNLCVLGYWVRDRIVAARKIEAEKNKEGDERKTVVAPEADKTVVIKMAADRAQSFGIETEPARSGVWRERTAALGRVVPNQKATYEIRSPFAGTLHAATTSWPGPGQTVRPGEPLARVTVRVAPSDKLDLLVRVSDARLKKKGAEDVVRLRQNLVDRLKTASAGVVTRRDMEDAEVQLVEAQTQLKTATEAFDLWEKALGEIETPNGSRNETWRRTLTAPEAGAGAVLEVADVAALPGTNVEAGGVVMRLVDVSRPLVRLELPAEALHDGPPPSEVALSRAAPPPPALRGASNRPEAAVPDADVRATLVGPVSQADLSSQFIGYYYAPQSGEGALLHRVWRPGMFVQASLPGAEEDAVVVPAAALLYHQGRALVYVQRPPDERQPGINLYERRDVRVLGFRDGNAYIVPTSPLATLPPNVGLKPEELVVSSGAPALLSTEFRKDTDDD
jgi:hypothetical protein